MLEHCSGILQYPEIAVFIEGIISSTLSAVDPQSTVRELLKINNGTLQIGDQHIPLDSNNRIRCVAIGKAALKMAAGAIDALGNSIYDGIVITKTTPDQTIICFPTHFEIFVGGHPIPTEESILSGKELKRFLECGKPEDVILVLLSGGGSALVQMPMDGIRLIDLQKITLALLQCGATIEEMNTVRKHLDLVKGGGFLRLTQPARVSSLIVSDVLEDRLDMIASGMTVIDPSSQIDALDVLERYHLIHETPLSVLQVLRKGMKRQTQEIRQLENQSIHPVSNFVIMNNASAVEGALSVARQAGWQVENLGWILHGEAEDTGRNLARLIISVTSDSTRKRPICLVGGGETTVHVHGKGFGGRNLEVALGAVNGLAGLTKVALITLATDGEDGQTGFAGAVVTENTQRIADRLGLLVQNYLDENNSCRFFEAVGGLVKTGSTGTNVNDLVILLAW